MRFSITRNILIRGVIKFDAKPGHKRGEIIRNSWNASGFAKPSKGDPFAARNQYAMKIDFEQQPPLYQVSETHYAATWLLHPNAPKVEPPESIKQRMRQFKAQKGNHIE